MEWPKVLSSKIFGQISDEYTNWNARFVGKGLPDCDITVNSRGVRKEFLVSKCSNEKNEKLVTQFDPFDSRKIDWQYETQDRRVPYLVKLCRSFRAETNLSSEWYKDAIELWSKIEKLSIYSEG